MADGPASSNGSAARVLVVGGGFGGLEAAFKLRSEVGAERARITIVSDADHFLFKPNSIYVPFGLDPEKLRVPLAPAAAKRDIELIRGSAVGVDPDSRTVGLEDGRALPYDRLVLATGSGMRAAEIPGLAEHAIPTWTPDDMVRLGAAFRALTESRNGGGAKRSRVLFLVPPNNKCAGPLYEIVLMLETWLRKHGARERVEITWATCEHSYIQAFGPRLHDVVTDEFERRGITGLVDHVVESVEAGAARFTNGVGIEYDTLVAFPPYIAARTFPGLPADDRGFIATEQESRRVVSHPEVFAVGDAGDFPVKQAFLAFLQADAAAAHIAAELKEESPRNSFDPVSMCVMEQFDKATFAQVPLQTTGNPDRPVEVRPGAGSDYRVGSSKAWRLGKKTLGHAVPWRFAHGLPFHSGPFWAGMDTGLKGMSRALAK